MKKRIAFLATVLMMVTTGCSPKAEPVVVLDDNYRTFYEVFVRSFADSDGDRIGDFNGLSEKLDYINDGDTTGGDDLGATGIWLMPIMPSPTYHKYDVKDYMSIDPQYGTMEDFEAFMAKCQERDIHVILDLVMNHTSSHHPWFQEACNYLRSLPEGAEPSTEECKYFGYYHFKKDVHSSTYYKVTGTDWYYEGAFWSEMPDLDLFNEDLRAEFAEVVDFWFAKGVSGFRLDAVKEFESGNDKANIEILTWFNDMVKEKKEDAYLVGEAWAELPTYAKYYPSGLDSLFDFQFGDGKGIIAKVVNRVGRANAKTYATAIVREEELFAEKNPNYINAPFYTNHDMNRSAEFYKEDELETKVKLAQALNLTMSGNAFLYYGEELGMKGSGKDENKRLPMYWSTDKEAPFMCDKPNGASATKQVMGSVEEQLADEHSVLSYVQELMRLRNTYPAIARGTDSIVEEWLTDDVCALRKTFEDKELILLINLSNEPQTIDMTGVTIGEKEASKKSIAEKLLMDEKDVEINGDVMNLPAYSLVLLQ